MIEMTTKSSTKVKPRSRLKLRGERAGGGNHTTTPTLKWLGEIKIVSFDLSMLKVDLERLTI